MLTTTVFPLFPQPRHFRSRTNTVKIESPATPILFLANSLAEDLNARSRRVRRTERAPGLAWALTRVRSWGRAGRDRKSTRLNSSHANISYAVFCLKNIEYTNIGRTSHSQTILISHTTATRFEPS